MSKRLGLCGVVLGISLLALNAGTPLGQFPDSESAIASGFKTTLTNTVRLDILGSNLTEKATNRIDLLSQFISLGTFDLTVYAVTNYEVHGQKDTTVTLTPGGTTGPRLAVWPVLIDALMEISVTLEGADDGVDNPSLGSLFGAAGTFVDLPDFGSQLLFKGGNSMGGTQTGHVAQMALRIDLDALKNNASGNIYDFEIQLRVIEV